MIADYRTRDVKVVARTELPEVAVYAVAFHPQAATVAAAGSDGLVRLIDVADGTVQSTFAPAPIDQAAANTARQKAADIDFIQDVNPVLSRMGCNAGICHGAAQGKNGFKLSLRGYDALFDVRALTDDHGSRRVSLASPDDSLMLLKATAAVPHEGGQRVKPDQPYYQIIRDWIAGGAELDPEVPRVTGIQITPQNPVLEKPQQQQPMAVVATYSDGSTRQVTREAFITSGNTEVATADDAGTLTAIRRGEAPVLARYEGAYAATTLTVMGNREGFRWEMPPRWGRIDQLVAAKWERIKIRPSALCTDSEFIRRVYLDLTGLPPTVEEVRAFLDDPRETRQKRDELVDALIGSPDYIEHWSNKWADLLQVNRKFLGQQGAVAFRQWIRDQVAANTPYDQFARKVLTAEGSNRENPAASYFKVLRTPEDLVENTTQLFLAIRFNCNKCHDHPFERWTQDQYYQTAAYFARVGLKRDPASGKKTIGGTAVEGAKPLYEVVLDRPQGEVVHDRTQAVTPPQFPFACRFESAEDASRRQQLAAWITSSDNPYFARSYVNRLWGYLFGVGIIEPIDDIRAGNPATNPELLEYLTEQFVQSGFDVRQMLALICKSRTYQLSFRTNRWNEDDRQNYSHALPRRLPAEVLYDALHRVTGSISKLPGVPPGTRAAALPDAGIKLPSGFLDTMGRPARQSACECERTSGLELGPVMALISGPTVAAAIGDPNNELAKLVAETSDDAQLISGLVMRILNRPASDAEVDATLKALRDIDTDHAGLVNRLQQLENQLAPTLTAQQAERQQRIDEAQAELARYREQHAAARGQQKRQRQVQIQQAEAALAAYEQQLPVKFAAWEAAQADAVHWQPVQIVSAVSTGKATLNVLPDQSVLAEGPNPIKDTRTVTARTKLDRITAIRLEALTHPSLPQAGPGRAANGNFVLSQLRLLLADGEAGTASRIELVDPWATFSQDKYPVANSLQADASSGTGWAVVPQTGKSHVAFYLLKEPLVGAGEKELRFALVHEYPHSPHTLGRFRISVTHADVAAIQPPEIKLQEWYHVGPFPGGERDLAFSTPYPPEERVELGETFQEGKLQWQARPAWKDGQVHMVFQGQNAANYIYRRVVAPVATRLPISLGSDDAIKVFLNGKQLLAHNIGRGAAADQELLTLDLAAGVNHLLLKIVNFSGPSGFFFRADTDKAELSADVLAALLHASPEERTEQQRGTLREYFRQRDGELQQRVAAVARAKRPLPPDAGLQQREKRLQDARQPLSLDPKLVALRKDVQISQQQLNNKRLTVAQDLAWALINSPAFLFNH